MAMADYCDQSSVMVVDYCDQTVKVANYHDLTVAVTGHFD